MQMRGKDGWRPAGATVAPLVCFLQSDSSLCNNYAFKPALFGGFAVGL